METLWKDFGKKLIDLSVASPKCIYGIDMPINEIKRSLHYLVQNQIIKISQNKTLLTRVGWNELLDGRMIYCAGTELISSDSAQDIVVDEDVQKRFKMDITEQEISVMKVVVKLLKTECPTVTILILVSIVACLRSLFVEAGVVPHFVVYLYGSSGTYKTTLRRGEILGIKFADFDKENNTLYIQKQITNNPIIPKGNSKIEEYRVVEKEPKTDNSYRRLKLPEVVAEEIEKRRLLVESNKQQYGERYYDHDYISCQDNGVPHSVSAMNGALTKLCSRNGLPHITVHGLRHMYATILIEQGVPLIKISALLGHASVTTTFEYYCDVMDENEQIINFMNNTFTPEGSVVVC